MSGRRWDSRVADFACAIELLTNGDWLVTIASTTISRGRDLVAAIVEAGGGCITRSEAEAVALSVKARRSASASPPIARALKPSVLI